MWVDCRHGMEKVKFIWGGEGETGSILENRFNSAKLEEPMKPTGELSVGSWLCAPAAGVLVKVILAAVRNKNRYNISSMSRRLLITHRNPITGVLDWQKSLLQAVIHECSLHHLEQVISKVPMLGDGEKGTRRIK